MSDAVPNHIPDPDWGPPQELRALPGWLIWRYETQRGESKPRKVPYYAQAGRRSGKQGAPQDRAKLVTFDVAVAAAERLGFNGVGLAMLPDWGLVALDFDNCVTPGCGYPPEIEAIVSRTYAELSPSGRGIRAFVRGDLGNHKSLARAGDGWSFEVFSTVGFVTVTGNMLPFTKALGLEELVAPVCADLRALCADRFQATRVSLATNEPASDDFMVGHEPRLGLTHEEIANHLAKLDPSMERVGWIKVGMAVHHETEGVGFDIWDDWSSGGSQYPGTEALERQWASFGRSRPSGAPNITMATVLRMAKAAEEEPEEHGSTIYNPVDPWLHRSPPELPAGVLPEVIERFARIQGEQMGADAGGLAQAALTVCAAAIPDSIQLQVKVYDPSWRQSPRLWSALVGPPSAKKSPILKAAMSPLRMIDLEARRRYKADLAAFEALPADERKSTPAPTLTQRIVEDITVEALGKVAANNPEGVLCHRDELSAWFGTMEKYSGPKGASADRGVYLQAYDGGSYAVGRIGRGEIFIENLSVNLLGGIQPDAIRHVTKDTPDDGLVQRLTPIVLGPSAVGKDEPAPDVASEYEVLVRKLVDLTLPVFDAETLTLDDGGQEVRRRLEVRHHELSVTETINRKLASHIGKFDGMFARLCVLFHCILNADESSLPPVIGADTAERAAAYLHKFLLPHALAFYTTVLGMTDDDDLVRDVAGYILAHNEARITARTFKRGSTAMKALNREQIRRVMQTLEALGWGEIPSDLKPNAAPRFIVDLRVHTVFTERARDEVARRAEIRRTIAELHEGGS